MSEQKLYVDEKCVVSNFWGELGWFLQRWQGYLRYLKHKVYPNHKFILFTDLNLHPFVDDFVVHTISLPKEFYDLGLDRDCYESVEPGSPAGSLLDSTVHANLISYCREFYNKDKAVEVWSPRGANYWVDDQLQIFCRYKVDNLIKFENKDIVVVFPRARVRASNRNVPEFVWYDLVNKLSQVYKVVLAGTPNGACLVDYENDNTINLIKYDKEDKTDKIIQFLNSAVCSISSQSGGTHISLLSYCPSYIIGHEKERHTTHENRLNTPASFRYVVDYRAIDANTIINDVIEFINILRAGGWSNNELKINRPALRNLFDRKNLVGAEIGVFEGKNAWNMLSNLDIQKLYLIDPYDFSKKISGFTCDKEDAESAKNLAKSNLLELWKGKLEFIYEDSKTGHSHIEDESLDFVYLDGDHKYEGIKSDIKLYYNKVKSGGLVAGHDYENKDVTKAVNEFFENKDIEVFSDIDPEDNKTYDWWCFKYIKMNRPGLRILAGMKNLVGVEIGVDTGVNSLDILKNLNIEKLYLVDPYSIYRNIKGIGCNHNKQQCLNIKEEAHNRLKNYEDRVEWIEKLSEYAIEDIPDNLDFVYVDGNHRHEYVKRDIELYFPKIKDGGIIVFHDYDYSEVKQAVDEKFRNSIKISACVDNTKRLEAWYIKHPKYADIIKADITTLESLI